MRYRYLNERSHGIILLSSRSRPGRAVEDPDEAVVTTISDVAREAGVSASTVSQVLNGNKRVDARLVARVARVVKELNYRPNRVARSLRLRHNRVWALVISDVRTGPFFVAASRCRLRRQQQDDCRGTSSHRRGPAGHTGGHRGHRLRRDAMGTPASHCAHDCVPVPVRPRPRKRSLAAEPHQRLFGVTEDGDAPDIPEHKSELCPQARCRALSVPFPSQRSHRYAKAACGPQQLPCWTNFFFPYVMFYNDTQYPLPVGLQYLIANTSAFNPTVAVSQSPVLRPEQRWRHSWRSRQSSLFSSLALSQTAISRKAPE